VMSKLSVICKLSHHRRYVAKVLRPRMAGDRRVSECPTLYLRAGNAAHQIPPPRGRLRPGFGALHASSRKSPIGRASGIPRSQACVPRRASRPFGREAFTAPLRLPRPQQRGVRIPPRHLVVACRRECSSNRVSSPNQASARPLIFVCFPPIDQSARSQFNRAQPEQGRGSRGHKCAACRRSGCSPGKRFEYRR